MERIRGIVIKTLTVLAGFWIADLAAARVQAGIKPVKASNGSWTA